MTVAGISSRPPWLPAQDKDSQNSSTDGEGPPNPTLGGAIGSGWLLKGVWGESLHFAGRLFTLQQMGTYTRPFGEH